MKTAPKIYGLNKNIDVSHKVVAKNDLYSMHIHNNFELFFCRSNNNRFFVGNKIYEANKNDMFLFDRTDLHKISVNSDEVYDRYVVLFSPDLVQHITKGDEILACFDKRSAGHSHKISFDDKGAKRICTFFEKLIEYSDENIYANELKSKITLIELLIFINETKEKNKLFNALESKTKHEKINDIIYYLSNNFNSQITLDMLSKEFFLDKYYLCRLFKAETGFGINDFILSCRLSNAVILLKENLSVSEVAEKSGFCSDTYFISCFTKAIGISPKKFAQKK